MTAQEELEKVDAAIARILDTEGQEWQQGGRSKTNARLQDLYARKTQLEDKIALQARGGRRVTRFVPR